MGKLGADGLEASDFELQDLGAGNQLCSCLEAVPTIECVVGEIAGDPEAGEQHKDLLQGPMPTRLILTQHEFRAFK